MDAERSSRKQCLLECIKIERDRNEMQKEKCGETIEDVRGKREEGESDPYSGKVELGCNGGWLGRLPRLMEGVKRYGAVRDRMKGRRGGWRRERG